MYKYLLFHYNDYYPSGGMEDCVLKTNNLDEFIPFINAHCNEAFMDRFHYYDTVEDKCIYAEIEQYEDENDFPIKRFLKWED